jgi:hypothetical protein
MKEDLQNAGYDGDVEPDLEYRADQLLYIPRLRRPYTPYGFSAVEQAIVPITLGMQRQNYLLDFYAEGSIPGTFVIAGDQYVTPAQQRQLQDTLNAIAGDVAWKHRVIVLPPGSKTDPQKNMDGQYQMDSMVAEQVAMILHIQPHEIGMVPGGRSSALGGGGKGQAEQQAASATESRTMPDAKWWKETCFDWLIQNVFGQDDLEWKWLDFEEAEDDATRSQTEQAAISMGKSSIDEIRVEAGEDPWNFPLTQSPFLIVPGVGMVPLNPTVAPPAPPAPPVAPGGGAGVPAGPAGAALANALQPAPGKDPEKPKNNPAVALMSGKKKDRKKARAEIQDRFEGNLKHATKKDPQKQPQPLPPAAIAPQTAPQPATATQPPGTPQAGAPAPAQQNLPPAQAPAQAPAQRPRQKMTVANLVKGKIKYKGDLTPIVYKYLLRSYPAKVIDWVQDTKGADWEYDPHVKLSDINMARRPGGRDPEKVASIANTLSDGASLDPIVLVDAGNPNGLEIADGWHRALGAEKAGLDDLPAFIGEGFGDDQGLDAPWGTAMQNASSSVQKATLAEVATLRRFLRKGGDVAKFTTTAIDPDTMKKLTADLATMDRDAALDAARDRVAKQKGNPQGLIDWYNSGADGQIDWGSDGDFMQCVGVASAYMDDDQAKGFCQLRHMDATGETTSEHAAEDKVVKSDNPLDFDMTGSQGEGRHCENCDAPLTRFEKGTRCTNCKVGDLAPTDKSISIGAPLSTGVVPFDLAGQVPRKCPQCGLTLDEDGLCPTHGTAVKSNENHDEQGRFASGDGGGKSDDAIMQFLGPAGGHDEQGRVTIAGRVATKDELNRVNAFLQQRSDAIARQVEAERQLNDFRQALQHVPPGFMSSMGPSPTSKMQADNLLAAVEAELLKRGINPLADA